MLPIVYSREQQAKWLFADIWRLPWGSNTQLLCRVVFDFKNRNRYTLYDREYCIMDLDSSIRRIGYDKNGRDWPSKCLLPALSNPNQILIRNYQLIDYFISKVFHIRKSLLIIIFCKFSFPVYYLFCHILVNIR